MANPKPSAYIETTVPSYVTAWPSGELVVAGHQQITKTWWREAATRYDLFVSQTVLDEATQGDPAAARDRLACLRELTVLPFAPDVQSLAAEYLRLLYLPPKATNDAVHLAYAVVFELVYLVTWNMRHLANGLTMRRVTEYNTARSLHVPLIVTPEYLVQLEQEDVS